MQRPSSLTVAMLGELSFICVGGVAIVYLFAMSEGRFILFLLLFVFGLWRAVEDDDPRWIIVAGGAAAAASMTRAGEAAEKAELNAAIERLEAVASRLEKSRLD